MDRLGLGYEALRRVNPGIIYCSISGYGHTGPERYSKGWDIIIEARSGIMTMTGPPSVPTRQGNSISDWIAGLNAALSIVTALYYKKRTGRGQRIDIALFDGLVGTLDCAIESYTHFKELTPRARQVPGYGVFECSDGFICLACALSEPMWVQFCKLIGKPEYLKDPRIKCIPARMENRDFVNQIIEEWTSKRTCNEALKALSRRQVPCSPINTIDKVVKDPQLRSRNMLVKVYHPVLKRKVEIVGSALKLSETPGRVVRGAPELGEHTEYILSTILGYSEEDIAELKKEGVLK